MIGFVPKEMFFTKGVGKHREKLTSFELALRYYVARHFDVYLREDLGVLFDSGTHFVDSTTAAGIEEETAATTAGRHEGTGTN